MSRDHSCETCGRGGMNDCQDAEITRLKAEAVRAWDNARQREAERDCLKAEIKAKDALAKKDSK